MFLETLANIGDGMLNEVMFDKQKWQNKQERESSYKRTCLDYIKESTIGGQNGDKLENAQRIRSISSLAAIVNS